MIWNDVCFSCEYPFYKHGPFINSSDPKIQEYAICPGDWIIKSLDNEIVLFCKEYFFRHM